MSIIQRLHYDAGNVKYALIVDKTDFYSNQSIIKIAFQRKYKNPRMNKLTKAIPLHH